ncbi:MAG TPA: dTDP-4-dehydrorhamnose 3,5-epimerase [Achromobacter sp.]|jgi:dTDP-4-dehydrorhamnose 3,5-epimerase|nr:dTDP-4-dehydrorhamnose 3,5-epimerase [Achromobacter sp.]
MNVLPQMLPEVLLLEPHVFHDERGFFFESFNERAFEVATGLQRRFVQENHSCSAQGVLRGLHYQLERPQGKLVRVCAGEIFDVAVDIRRSSPTFGKWVGTRLSAANKRQVWIPEGYAHGFVALSDSAEVLYRVTDYYAPDRERCIRWDDPDLAVAWPLKQAPVLSAKDRLGAFLKDAELD